MACDLKFALNANISSIPVAHFNDFHDVLAVCNATHRAAMLQLAIVQSVFTLPYIHMNAIRYGTVPQFGKVGGAFIHPVAHLRTRKVQTTACPS